MTPYEQGYNDMLAKRAQTSPYSFGESGPFKYNADKPRGLESLIPPPSATDGQQQQNNMSDALLPQPFLSRMNNYQHTVNNIPDKAVITKNVKMDPIPASTRNVIRGQMRKAIGSPTMYRLRSLIGR